MHKWIMIGLLAVAPLLHGQGVRIDWPLLVTGPNVPISGGPLPQALFLANATVSICTASATINSCIPVTTYTDATLTTACPINAPLVQTPGTLCTASAGPKANIGFWYAGGTVAALVSSSYGPFGPYPISGVSGIGTFVPFTGGNLTGPLNGPAFNSVQVVGQGTNATIQAAITAAGATGSVFIPCSYTGTDRYTNPNHIYINNCAQQTSLYGSVDMTQFGANADYTTIVVNISGTVVTATSGTPFLSTDPGKGINESSSISTIASYISSTQITTAAGLGNCTGCSIGYGTDNSPLAVTAFGLAVANHGTKFYYPPGTPGVSGTYAFFTGLPLSIPDGSLLYGGGPATTNLLTPVSTGNFWNVGAGDTGSGGTTGIDDVELSAPNNATGCLSVNNTEDNFELVHNFFASGGSAICAGGVVGEIALNVFDSNLFNGVVLTGNGIDPGGQTHNITLTGNQYFALKNTCVSLGGVADVDITGENFQGCMQYAIAATTTSPNYRINVGDSTFLCTNACNNSQIFINYQTGGAGGCIDCKIHGSTMAYSQLDDIFVNGSQTVGMTISDMTFAYSAQTATNGSPGASVVISNVGSSQVALRNNRWHNPRGYATKAMSAALIATNNEVTGAFTVSGVPGTASQSGAIWNSGTAALYSIIRGNSTVDTGEPIYSVSGSQNVYSSENLSANSTSDVVGTASGAINSFGERATGGFTPSAVNFPSGLTVTTVSASSTVSGTGFSTYLASPPAIGGTAPAAGAFTTLTASSGYRLVECYAQGTAASSNTHLSMQGCGGAIGFTTGTNAGALPISWTAATIVGFGISCATAPSGTDAITIVKQASGAASISTTTMTLNLTTAYTINTMSSTTTNPVSLAAGDKFGIQIATSGTETLANCGAVILLN